MAQPEFTTSVAVRHMPEQSDAEAGQHAFAYTVTIRNSGDVTAQLIARHWIVTDALGHVDEVRGLAVVGHQPLLKPGESFEYT
ncbi:MAG: ApaG domain, partial [Caldimonas sp.]